MTKYQVEVRRSITIMVDVEADTPEHAAEIVGKADFPLPERDAWNGVKDWSYVVYDPDGEELLEVS